MRVIMLLLCVLFCGQIARAQSDVDQLPKSTVRMLNRRLPGWKLPEVSPEIHQFVKNYLKAASPVVINGDFDGNGRRDYAVLIHRGYSYTNGGYPVPRDYLVVFLRRNTRYKMYVIKNPGAEYIVLAKKGTKDYNYTADKEIIYENDAIEACIFEKGGSSYIYKNGRFISFISSD